MKKSVLVFCVLLILSFCLPVCAVSVQDVAAQKLPQSETAKTYYAESRNSSGIASPCDNEYVVLNPDGTGIVAFEGCAYTLTWESSGETLTFTDHMGNRFEGAIFGSTLTGEFHGSTYTYVQGENAPMMALSPESWGVGLPYVTDQADILTDSEEQLLSESAVELSEQHSCNIYIVTMDDMRSFSSSGNIETCAEELRTGYSLGYGIGKDCIVLLLSMAERDYDLMAFGSLGNAAFTDYGKDVMESNFLDNFGENDWFGGFSDYLSESDRLLTISEQGQPLDVGTASGVSGFAILGSVLVGALVALIFCSIVKHGMKSVKAKTEAGNYIPQGGIKITYRNDQYTHSTESRVYDPPQSNSGGGTSLSSSGHSHSSGKF